MVFIGIGLTVVAAIVAGVALRAKPSLDELGRVSPHWLALVAAFAAFCVTGFTQVALSEEGAS